MIENLMTLRGDMSIRIGFWCWRRQYCTTHLGGLRRGGGRDARLFPKGRSKNEITCLTSYLDADSLIRGTQVEENPIKSNGFEPLIMSTCLIENYIESVFCFRKARA